MALVQRYLVKLQKEQANLLEKLAKPKDKTEFGFGHLSGELVGLRRAGQLLAEILEDEKNDKTE